MKFQCQQSGKCCVSHGDHGFVYLTDHDVERLEKHLGIPARDFVIAPEFEYTRFSKTGGRFKVLANNGQKCQFLKGHQCGVYEARPTQCRSWPFFPEHMDPKKWDAVAEFCPGIGKGEELGILEPLDIVATQAAADKLY